MILQTMSYQEIAERFETIYEKVSTALNIGPYRRFFIQNKNAEDVVFKTRRRKIDANSYVYMIPFCKNYKEFKTTGLQGKVYLVYGTDNGRMVVYMAENPKMDSNDFSFCTTHFFDRYRERMLKDLSLSKNEVIEEYFIRNPDSAVDFIDDGNGEKSFIMSVNEGIELGTYIEPNIYIHKTFLPYDYLNRNQRLESEKLNTYHILGREILHEIRKIKREDSN